ncbi:MAG: LysR family transcriptional regulator [Sphingomonadaceae bacterium]|nr:LysR family transcriptional regulator [Sphingomonadaceae bacterium]
MVDVGQPTLDQLRVFLAVADQGSFNRAAKKLGRAISAVSYAITQLEAQLGVSVFERKGSRAPVLTEAGAALLTEAQTVIDDADALVARVKGLQKGLEAELPIAVDVMVPGSALAQMLRDFQRAFPTVPLRLHIEALGAVAALVLEGKATFGIAGPDVVGHPELDNQAVGSVELIPVAAPSHPLAGADELPPGEVRKHLQLVLTDRSALTEGQEFSVFSPRSWRLGDLGAKHALLREGIGWGYMPRHAITDDLASGALAELALPERPRMDFRFSAIWRRDAPPGPAACWLLDEVRQRLADPD